MKRTRSPKLGVEGVSVLEANILNLVWDGKKTVREVHETMLDEAMKKGAYVPYTTVMAAMNNMAHKGLLKQNKNGKAYTYKAAVSKDALIDSMIQKIQEVFV